jgi:carbamoyltransferase
LRSDELQAVTHVDSTARVQTVSQKDNPEFYQLLRAYKEITGSAVLVNTSFNVKDEPIVCSPQDAISCFSKTGMDYMVIGDYLVSRKVLE